MTALAALVERSLAADIPDPVRALAARLAQEAGAVAALFYGSNLRTGSLDGVLDFYLLTPGPRKRGIWPTVSYHETDNAPPLRAKVATMPLATFRAAAEARTLDTTIWARFVQPAALAWAADEAARREVVAAVTAAARSAARHAAALGPAEGDALDYWRALFRATYAAEFRFESGGRADHLLDHGGERWRALLPAAWAADGIAFAEPAGRLRPAPEPAARRTLLRRWGLRRRLGKPINALRLVNAASTFAGAARYAAWKIERHTGVPVALTPWRERHPLLAAPGVLWRVWRARRAA